MANRLVYVAGLVVALWGVFFALLPWEAILGSSGAAAGGCPYLPSTAFLSRWLPAGFHRMISSPLWHLGLSKTAPLSADVDGERRVDPTTGLPVFRRTDLQRYDGSDPSLPLLLGIAGHVFDVAEKGSVHYGKDAPYNVFAGKDSSRALTLGSFDRENLYSRCADTSFPAHFDEQQAKALQEQLDFYKGKYGPAVGLIDPDSPCPTAPPKTKEEEEEDARAKEAEAKANADAEEARRRVAAGQGQLPANGGVRTTFVVATPAPDANADAHTAAAQP